MVVTHVEIAESEGLRMNTCSSLAAHRNAVVLIREIDGFEAGTESGESIDSEAGFGAEEGCGVEEFRAAKSLLDLGADSESAGRWPALR